jgi:hypothetical protein
MEQYLEQRRVDKGIEVHSAAEKCGDAIEQGKAERVTEGEPR